MSTNPSLSPRIGGAPGGASSLATTGILLMIGFSILGPVIDVFGKLATSEVPAAEITLGRFTIQTLLLIPIVIWRKALIALSFRELMQHIARGVLMAIATVFFFSAIKYMPIADAISIFFVEPMILTLLGGLLLGEPVGWRRYVACAVGFAGAMIVIQPSFEELGWVSALPLGTALCFAFYLVLTRSMAQKIDPFAMQAYSGLSGAVFIALVLWAFEGSGDITFDPVWPSAYAIKLLIGVGLAATIAHMLIVYAFRFAPASVLAPLQYLEIVSATVFGYLIFDDRPDPTKWIGVAIIIASGLFIFARERAVAKRAND